MTTMTDSEALAVLDELSEYLAERADVKDGDYGQPEPNPEMNLHVELRQARGHIAEALRDREWRPIESAPEVDGDYFWCLLAWGPEGDKTTGEGFRWNGRWFAAGCFYQLGQTRKLTWKEIEVEPTHWVPKMEPPK